MSFTSFNPYTLETLKKFDLHSDQELDERLQKSKQSFSHWKNTPISDRATLLKNAAEILRENAEDFGRTISLEMGKPVKEAIGEVKKCGLVCDFYAENAEAFLKPEIIKTDARESYVRFDPIGTVLAIMPWNFPFWQVFRFAAPTLMTGNTAVLKHAGNVPQCALAIEKIFKDAGFPDGVYQNLFFDHDKTESIISHEIIKAVTLTGSERAGKTVASLAGKYLKKSLLELGGSNAFIVCEDADMDQAVETAITGRMMNSGQSCIAAKRFILVGSAYDAFLPKFTKRVAELTSGDPLDENTQVGPLARVDLAEELEKQMKKSVNMGAKIITGGNRDAAYFEPTILDNVSPGMPAFDQETFGPLAAIIRADSDQDAIDLANNSRYGLGCSIFTQDLQKAKSFENQIEDGAFFINEFVKSDPRLPFGGTKISGYGRELARDGILEFVNRKTVYVS